jgi:hypothetical protein
VLYGGEGSGHGLLKDERSAELLVKDPKAAEAVVEFWEQEHAHKRQHATFLLNAYVACVLRRPRSFVLVCYICIIGLVIAGLALMPPTLDERINALMKIDGNASRRGEAFEQVLALQKNTQHAQKGEGESLSIMFEIEIVYEARVGTVLTETHLTEIKNFESQLRELPSWHVFC